MTTDVRALQLAQHRQRITHENTNGSVQLWDGLTKGAQQIKLQEAEAYLRAAVEAGLMPLAERPTRNPSVTTDRVLSEVLAERIAQDAKWGEQNWHDFEGISVLTEEVGEAAQAANEANFRSGKTPGDYSLLRAELIQVAAVAVNHVEIIDRRTAADDETPAV